jgi:hypothetical protein
VTRFVLFGALALLLPARETRAEVLKPPVNQLTVDVNAASVGMTHASRTHKRRLGGFGVGLGLSPILGRTFASGSHFDQTPNVTLLEVGNVQFFLRFELLPAVNVDTGLRFGGFIHGNENFSGGMFAELFVAPALGWRWVWVGPRVSTGVLSEKGGQTAAVLVIDYVTLRFLWSW